MEGDELDAAEALTVRVPWWPLAVVAALVAGCVALAATAQTLAANVAGLTVALVAFGVMLVYRRRAGAIGDDLRYEDVPVVRWSMVVAIVVVILLFPLHAWPIALEVAER